MKYWDIGINVVEGCRFGCEVGDAGVCWAERMHNRFHSGKPFFGSAEYNPRQFEAVMRRLKPTVYHIWNDPLDLEFEDFDYLLGACLELSGHKFLILTKNPERIKPYADRMQFLSKEPRHANFYLGTSVTDQQTADRRIPELLSCGLPCYKWVNIEPMWGEVDLRTWMDKIDQVVLGFETGFKSYDRPVSLDWVRRVRDECERTGTPFFIKQLEVEGKDRTLDGKEHNELIWR